jgi:hypothetical protein
MATTLQDTLLTPGTKPHVVADCQALIDAEVDAKSGLSGAGLKVAYKAVTSFASGYYQSVITNMLPDMAAQLEPFWADFTAAGGGSFGDYLAKRGPEVAEALLKVTDRMGRESSRATVVKAYNAVRGGAAKHIEAALPALGALVQKYAG